MNDLKGMFFDIADSEQFFSGLQQSINALRQKDGIYCGDNLFTYGRNLGFLEDAPFVQAITRHATTAVE